MTPGQITSVNPKSHPAATREKKETMKGQFVGFVSVNGKKMIYAAKEKREKMSVATAKNNKKKEFED